MPKIDDLKALLDELNAAATPSTALDHKLHAIVHGWSLPLTEAAAVDFDRAADGGHLNRYTRYIDAAVQLAGQALPGWWWSCGHCKLSNDADVWVPGASMYSFKEERHGPGVGATPRLTSGAV